MANNNSLFNFIIKWKGLILSSVILFLMVVLVFLFLKDQNDLPRIDLEKGSESFVTEKLKKSPKELIIAFGARISPEVTYKYYEELMNIVGEKLGRKVRFIQKQTYSEINDLIENQRIDFAHVCSGPYTKGYEDFGMEILVIPVINEKRVYNCYIIVNKKSNINSFKELKGKKFAYTDPNSNTGFLVPNYLLLKMGETSKSFFRETFFTYSHDNSIKSVAENQSDGAAVDGIIWEFFNSMNPSITSRTKIIEKSPPYGIPPFVVHPELDQTLKMKLKNIFLNLHLDKKAVPLLQKINVDRFEEGNITMYDSVNKMRTWIKKNK